jgi:four helix bundle protein
MENKQQALKQQTRKFAVCILHLFQSLPKSKEGRVLGRQLLRAGTAVAANFRVVWQARSPAELIARVDVVAEKINEVILCANLIADGGIVPPQRLSDLQKESDELLAILAAPQLTTKFQLPTGLASNQPILKLPDEPMDGRIEVAMARSADFPELSAPHL